MFAGRHRGLIIVVAVVVLSPLVFLAALRAYFGREHRRALDEALTYLTPTGAELLSTREHHEDDDCWHHVIRKLRTNRAAVESWAARLDLPCADHGGSPGACARFSSSVRAGSFWKFSVGELGGLDSVDASLDGDVVTVDFGDYLCSGPFQ